MPESHKQFIWLEYMNQKVRNLYALKRLTKTTEAPKKIMDIMHAQNTKGLPRIGAFIRDGIRPRTRFTRTAFGMCIRGTEANIALLVEWSDRTLRWRKVIEESGFIVKEV